MIGEEKRPHRSGILASGAHKLPMATVAGAIAGARIALQRQQQYRQQQQQYRQQQQRPMLADPSAVRERQARADAEMEVEREHARRAQAVYNLVSNFTPKLPCVCCCPPSCCPHRYLPGRAPHSVNQLPDASPRGEHDEASRRRRRVCYLLGRLHPWRQAQDAPVRGTARVPFALPPAVVPADEDIVSELPL